MARSPAHGSGDCEAMTERRTTERRTPGRRSADCMIRERMVRHARLDDPADIAAWMLEYERATLASRERVRDIRGKLGLV